MQTSQPTPSIGKTPLVTFIVTYYNLQPQLLDECLDSILALSLNKDEREIIVVDDGSTQSPLEAIQSKLDDITYIRQRNSGLSAARNLGIEASRGSYLQFIDENTPAVFTVEQQKQAHNAQLNLMLSAFARYSGRAGIDSEALGKEAIALGRETGKYGMRLRTRMAYAMLCRCPWLLRAVYPMYCPVRLLINRVFGR